MNDSELEPLGKYTAEQIKSELKDGLEIFVETAFGWAKVRPSQFLKLVGNRNVYAYTELKKDGSITLKVPSRV